MATWSDKLTKVMRLPFVELKDSFMARVITLAAKLLPWLAGTGGVTVEVHIFVIPPC
jgi:hypothetical protein